jgi:hypothetical protein
MLSVRWVNNVRNWISDNRHIITTWAAIIQTCIAALMAWTLIQNQQVLRITETQLQSTIDPVLTPIMSGPIIYLVNDGIIDIAQVKITAAISVYFNIDTMKLSSPYRIARHPTLLADRLPPGDTLLIDPRDHLDGLWLHPTERTSLLYGLVVSYRRAVDMRQFAAFLPFTHSKDTETQTIDIFFPLFPSPRGFEMGPVDWPVNEAARSEITELYRNKLKPIDID